MYDAHVNYQHYNKKEKRETEKNGEIEKWGKWLKGTEKENGAKRQMGNVCRVPRFSTE